MGCHAVQQRIRLKIWFSFGNVLFRRLWPIFRTAAAIQEPPANSLNVVCDDDDLLSPSAVIPVWIYLPYCTTPPPPPCRGCAIIKLFVGCLEQGNPIQFVY